jgi:beta propeller domain-containing protein
MSGRGRVLLSFLWILLCAANGAAFARPGAHTGLTAFRSEKEMLQYFRKLKKEAPQQWNTPLSDIAVSGADAAAVTVTGTRVQGNALMSLTNTQHVGVDEGDIVKQSGDYLIMLRRGRLFTVNIGMGRLRPVASVNAYGPGIDPDHAWYDEMLVSEGTVVVIGFNYDVGATQIGLFDLYDDGHLIYRATYHFHSSDYYSSRNYASRLIGRKLIFYSPLYLGYDLDDPVPALPALRRWPGKETEKDFRRIIAYGQMYPAPVPTKSLHDVVLHTVTVCDLASTQFYCRASGIVGNSSEVFYVSPRAVYLWTDARGDDRDSSDTSERAMVYRVPLNGSAPSAVRASGQPVDQFSFLEGGDGQLNVVLREDAHGDHMWSAEHSAGSVALLRTPLSSFGDGTRAVPVSAYRPLPDPPDEGEFHNRFVGEWLLYGSEENEGDEPGSKLFIVHTGTARASRIDLPHHLSRIEAMGADAVAIGEDDEDLHFSGIRLADRPSRVQHYVLKGSAEGESRSHAFFYKPEAQGGLLGLPVRSPVDPKYAELLEDSAAIVFLRNSGSRFEELGQLRAHDESVKQDDCVASCVDWYGNARPLFIGDRVFALLGYELVEGRVQDGGIREVRRVVF